MTTGTSKICRLCHKDVSALPRVKDPEGNYYCEPCYAQAAAAAPAAVAAPAGAAPDELMLKDEAPRRAAPPAPRASVASAPKNEPPRQPAPPASDEIELKDPPAPRAAPRRPAKVAEAMDDLQLKDEPVARAAPRKTSAGAVAPAAPKTPAASTASAGSAAAFQLPDRCPACGTKVMTKSKFCVGCQRDMTKMDKLAAIIADGAKEDAAAKIGRISGRLIGIGAIVAIVAILVFVFWGQIMGMLGPGDAFAAYPTSRDKLVREFVAHVNGGSDKDFDAALKLVSQRETGIHASLDATIKIALKEFHDRMIKEHGADWYAKAKIVIPPTDKLYGDEVFAEIRLNDEAIVHIGLQAQIGIQTAMNRRRTALKKQTPLYEDGKMHWGIGEVREYPLVDAFSTDARSCRPGSDKFDDEETPSLPGL